MPKKNPTDIDKKKNSFRVSERRRKLKLLAIEYLGGSCKNCGYNKSPTALHFHHKDPSKKEFGLSSKGLTRSFNYIKKELDQCELLCANCHAEEHWKEDCAVVEQQRLFMQEHTEVKKETSIIKNCSFCKKEIKVYINFSSTNNYCSSKCSIKHRREISDAGWLPDEEMLKLKADLSHKEIAAKLNKTVKSVYRRFDTIRMRINRGTKPIT